MKRLYIQLSFIFCSVILLTTSCKEDNSFSETPDEVNIYTALANDGVNFSILTAAIKRAQLEDKLSAAGSFTLFAPTNAAFISAGYANVAAVNAADPAVLLEILNNHLLNNELLLENSLQPQDLTTVGNLKVSVGKAGTGNYFVSGADVTNANQNVSNGIFHVVNRVLVPAKTSLYNNLNSNPNLTLLAVAIRRASEGSVNLMQLLKDNGTYTLFAPNNAAFAAVTSLSDSIKIKATNPDVLAATLGYHLLNTRKFSPNFTDSNGISTFNQNKLYLNNRLFSGDRVNYTRGYVNGVAFDKFNANINATNGVMHVIGKLLVPSSNLLSAVNTTTGFTMLSAAITRASQGSTNFTQLLTGTELYTFFAPTDAAFIAAGYANVSAINAASPAVLAGILNFHLTRGAIFKFQLNVGSSIPAVAGGSISVVSSTTLKGNQNPSPVTTSLADVPTNNGVLFSVTNLLKP